MTRSRYLALCALVLAGSFAGGYIGRLSPVVHAQNLILPTDIRAKSFTLVDAQGNAQATFSAKGSGAELVLDDGSGKPRIEIAASGGIMIRDARGRVIWTSPKAGLVPASE